MKDQKFFYLFLFFVSFILICSIGTISASENISSDISNNILTVEKELSEKTITKNIEDTTTKEQPSKISLDYSNFDDYVTDGKFNENVTNGDTIDIQGKLDGSRFALNVNKPVNIISSNGEGYLNFHTDGYKSYGEDSGGIFHISKEGSGTNITGITIYNTRVSIENTSNIIINNITFLDEGANIGFGVGAVSIREGSENITITNSYFKTQGNGGHSNVVFAAAYNCLFENNTIEGYGDQGLIGNLLYLTTYNVEYATPATNINITIRNNTIRSYYTYGYGTCYGLALEGTGHIIENNIIDTAIPVRAQYADKDYDFETYLGSIYFNNNTITHSDYNNYGSEGYPAELTFPGIVANNTFINHGATLKQAFAYNNTFYTVTITNNTKFENNTAKSIIISGNNNTLNNNQIYSKEEVINIDISGINNSFDNNQVYSDYDTDVIIISGSNNTLSNNYLASLKGRGDNVITNSSEFISINNSVDATRIFKIDENNFNNYFYFTNNPNRPIWNTTIGVIDGDIFVLNYTNLAKNIGLTVSQNYVIENSTFAPTMLIGSSTSNVVIKNSILSSQINIQYLTLINSTIQGNQKTIIENINSTLLNTDYPSDNTYILNNPQASKQIISNGYLSNVNASATIFLYNYLSTSSVAKSAQYYSKDIYIDRPINLIGISGLGNIDSNIHFIAGSEGSNITNIKLNASLTINTTSINFYNNTINGNIEINSGYITFEGNTINGHITLDSTNDIIFNKNTITTNNAININNSRKIIIENNTITSDSTNTIVFDEDSTNNIICYNYLYGTELYGDESIPLTDNEVKYNYPLHDTKISIKTEDDIFINESNNIEIKVLDENNNSVSNGYIEIYLNGMYQSTESLQNGEYSFIYFPQEFNNFPLKVWYYPDGNYLNSESHSLLKVVKSNVTISVDEFTAKMNEKATTDITLLNQKGNPVQDTNITVTVGRTTYSIETVNGVASLDEVVTSEWLDSGKLTIAFPDTDMYNCNATTVTLNTSKADVLLTPEVTVDGSTANIKLTYADDLGQNVTDGKVSITTLDGTLLASGKVSNGVYTAIVALPEGFSDEYLVANFTGSYYYNDLVRNIKLSSMLNSTITIETNSPLYGEELVINGKLVDSKNTPIGGANLTLNLNGSKVIVTTNDDGEYNYTYTPGLGVNSLTVTFDGTVDVYGSSASKDVTIRDTDREMNEVLNRLDDLQKENEKLQEQNNKTNEQLDNITQANNELKEQLDNLTKDNNDLSKQLNDTKNNLTQQNNDLQEQNKELNDKLDSTAKNLTDANKALQEQNKDAQKQLSDLSKANDELKEQLNNTTNDLTKSNNDLKEQITDLKDQNKALQDQNKQLNDKLDAILKQLEDSVAKDTVITINNVPSARFGQNVIITGKLSDCDGNVISSSPVSVNVGGSAQKVTTDNNGVYNLTVRASVVGDNSVVVSFDADNKFNYAENTTTFKVTRQNLVLKLDSIKAVYYGDKVKVTGVLSDANGKLIANTLLNLDLNGKVVKVKTVAGGKFTYTVVAKTVGTNNVTVSYSGNKNYNSVSAKKTFKVYKQGLKITVNKITGTKYKNTVKVTGKLTDANGKVIMNTLVTININGRAYTAKTNNKGVYTLTLKATTLGVNNVTVSYKGNKNYKKATAKTTFRVAKQNVKVTLTGSSYSNAKATITGKLVDANNKVLMNSNVKITINNKTYTAKTNTEGIYTLTKPVTSKKITLTLAYNGNKNYNAYKKTSNVTLA